MSAKTILVSETPGEVRAIALDNQDQPTDLAIERMHARPMKGAVLLGRVRTVHQGLQGAFVDLGHGVDGFLGLKDARPSGAVGGNDDIVDYVKEGDAVVVKVTRDAVEDKGPRLKAVPNYEGHTDGMNAPCSLKDAPDLLSRCLSEWAGVQTSHVIVDGVDAYRRAQSISPIDVTAHQGSTDLFAAYGCEGIFDDTLEPVVPLAAGGNIIVSETPAMCAIDVNTGACTPLEVNLHAATAIARQVRLRDIGGRIAVDFLSMRKKAQREQVLRALKRAFSSDPATIEISGFSPFGLVEVIRSKDGASIAEVLSGTTASLQPSAETVALRALAALVNTGGGQKVLKCAPTVQQAITGHLSDARMAAEARLGFDIRCAPVTDWPQTKYEIVEAKP